MYEVDIDNNQKKNKMFYSSQNGPIWLALLKVLGHTSDSLNSGVFNPIA